MTTTPGSGDLSRATGTAGANEGTADELPPRLFRFEVGLRPYLDAPVTLPSWVVLLCLLFALENVHATFSGAVTTLGIGALLALLLLGFKRRHAYSLVFVLATAVIAWMVFGVANGPQDSGADRDEAVAIAARALAHGDNAWTPKTALSNNVTTGPSSILLAVPVALLTGQVDVLTFAIWMAFVAFLLACDLSSRSGTFAGLLVLAALPWTGLAHTLYWAGDELYYAVVLSPVMVALLRRRLPFAAGLLAGFMLFSRLSYGFACFGVVLWLMLARRESLRDLATFVLGAIVYCGVVWGLFWLVGGADFLEANFVRYAMVNGVEDTQNPLMRAYIDWRNAGADRRLTDVAVIMALMTAVASLPQMRRAAHPFWHLALGGLMAHTLAISPVYKLDYVLTITIPAFYALALGGRGGESPSRR